MKLQNSHPCFGGHVNNAGRIHLPVSPGCNIACRFCDRTINDAEERPGVTSKVILPEESADILKCMSTNGLLLYERTDEIIDIGIDSLTVTVNAVDPDDQG